MMLRIWIAFALLILIGSFCVHVSTFFGIDPMDAIPGVMFIHILIFPPFVAAIIYARVGGTDKGAHQRVMGQAPKLLRALTGFFFAYAFVNFIIFLILNEGGSVSNDNGKYTLKSHGRLIRELTEQEFHLQQGYVVRGFSGHWMLFASAALTLLVGSARIRAAAVEQADGRRRTTSALGTKETSATPPASAQESSSAKYLDPRPASPRAAMLGIVTYAGCLASIFSPYRPLWLLAAVVMIVAAIRNLRAKRGFPREAFESGIGCLSVFPNFYFATKLGGLIAQIVYVAIYVGYGPALTGEISVTFPKEGPLCLSNGEPLRHQVWSALSLLVQFPLAALGTLGLTYLMECVGRWVEVGPRRRRR